MPEDVFGIEMTGRHTRVWDCKRCRECPRSLQGPPAGSRNKSYRRAPFESYILIHTQKRVPCLRIALEWKP